MDYNKTLNLTKTDFSMRAGLPQREPEFLAECEKNKLYEQLLEKNKDRPKYILHDGPPYANGDIHIGHALNKILKDFLIRYKNMSGFSAPMVHGWDTHGLPIELQAMKKFAIDSNKTSILEFRKHCKDFALSYVENQRNQFKRLGLLGDFDNPYLTLNPEFEAKQVEVFGEMANKGFIYKGLKPVYWCPHDVTALAEAEIEYDDDKCDSIYVKFKVIEDNGLFKEYSDNVYFVIWTTTTWTLPGNTAICLGEKFEYSLVKVGDECYILASDLIKEVVKIAGIDDYKVLATFKGSELESIKTIHPFMDRESPIILGDHVTLETGTGCVHTAPGHGMEDYQVSLKYKNVPIIVPVDDNGYMTEEAGKFKGLYYEKSNAAILEELKDSNSLLAVQKLVHQYPHCWRCKNPVIFRATEQWFCSIDKFREKAIGACKQVKWVPEWGMDRMIGMIRDRNDWCISRQRIWGVPIPIFYCKECNTPIINKTTIKIISDLFRKKGSDSWYQLSAAEILNGSITCECGCNEFEKEKDIMDVWFDSGSSSFAVLEQREELGFPADTYIEGVDQYRGWFQSSLLISVAVRGVPPYKNVYSHGFTVDGEGKKMSKSVGNTVVPNEVVKDYGSDILRLWVSSSEYTSDVRVSNDMLKQLSEIYRKIRNTARFMLGNLNDFNPNTDMVSFGNASQIDKWALIRLNNLVNRVTNSFENCEYHTIFHAIHNFCVVDMSNFYLDVIKDRLYIEKIESSRRRASQSTMYIILNSLVRMLAPILFFTSEEIWKAMPKKDGEVSHVMLAEFPENIEEYKNAKIEADFDRILYIREIVKKALEESRASKVIGSSLEAKVTLHCDDTFYNFCIPITNDLKTMFIISDLEIVKADNIFAVVTEASGEKCERCWVYNESVGENKEHPTLCKRCSNIIS